MAPVELPAWVFEGPVAERGGVHQPEGSWSASRGEFVPPRELPVYRRQLFRAGVVGADADQRSLSGDEKAAALLLALGPDFGRPILEELDEVEIRILSRAMVRLGPITKEMLDELLGEFVMTVSSNGGLAGNSDTTQRLLLSFLPADRVDSIMEEIRGPAGRNMWEKLSNVQEDILASYLKNEYPQTIAVVLSKIADESLPHPGRVSVHKVIG